MKTASTPNEIPMRFTEAWNARDAEGIAQLFEEDADFINVVGLWWDNKEDIRKAHDYGLKVIFNESTLKVGRVKVKMLSDDIAVIHTRMRLTGQKLQGNITGLRQNLFLFVARKSGGHWLCVSAQNTDIVIGAETNFRDDKGNLTPIDYRNL